VIICAMARSKPTSTEAERQLAAAAERHAEVLAAMSATAEPALGREAAARALGRGVQLISFTLRRAADAGVGFDRLVQLSGLDETVVREALEHGPQVEVIARLAPEGVDARAAAEAAASFQTTVRAEALLRGILADVSGARTPTAAELGDLCDRLEAAWREWRDELGRDAS
jgi:hypothetical protein